MRAAKQEADVFPLAAFCLLAENSHQGHRLPTAVLHRGFTPVNSSTATGFDAFLYDSGRRSRSTGKERDSETGLDYFGARYFSAAQGRFTSADWAAKPEAVPYANLEDPQTLNLYGYVRNNPLAKSDKDGHGELQPLDSQQMQSVQSDMAALNQFTVEHPILTNVLLNVGMAILSRGEAGPGGRVESGEGTGGGVPEAPTMRSGQREAMRQENIPTSQQPTTQTNTPAGRQYEYEVPKPGGGTTAKVVQRNNGTDSSHPGELHVEAGTPKPGKPTPTDTIGRPRLDSNKTKVNVKKPDGN